MIDQLRGIFDRKIVKSFAKKVIEVTFKDDNQSLEFKEDSKGSALRKLTIFHRGNLVNQQLPDTVVIEADFATGDHSKYSRFIKNDAFFLTKQCDFFILHQQGDKLYVAICDMKSSQAGDDDRCKEQIKHAEFFLTYLLESALYAEEIKKRPPIKSANTFLSNCFSFLINHPLLVCQQPLMLKQTIVIPLLICMVKLITICWICKTLHKPRRLGQVLRTAFRQTQGHKPLCHQTDFSKPKLQPH
jgi:hypothetical protein